MKHRELQCIFWIKVDNLLRQGGYKSVYTLCSESGISYALFRSWFFRDEEPSTIFAERIARALKVPLYTLIDNGEEVPQYGVWSQEQVEASSLLNVGSNVRGLCCLHSLSARQVALDMGGNVRQVERIQHGDLNVWDMDAYRQLAQYFSISIQDLFSDYTRSERVHTAFERMNPRQRLAFMAALKGVSKKYLCDISRFRYSMFRKSEYKKFTEMQFAAWMCQYFNIPLWWVLDLPRRDPWRALKLPEGASLRTNWNAIL